MRERFLTLKDRLVSSTELTHHTPGSHIARPSTSPLLFEGR